jgi:membrane protein DedA with SNARE-associated domain
VGFLFGNSWNDLAHVIKDLHRVAQGLVAVLALVGLIVYLKRRARSD